MEGRCRLSKKDQAARIAEKILPLTETVRSFEIYAMRGKAERAIRRAITSAVRKERERCVKCIMPERERYFLDRTIRVAPHLVCEEIIEKINGGRP